jgi:multiple sugar transport system permease protein
MLAPSKNSPLAPRKNRSIEASDRRWGWLLLTPWLLGLLIFTAFPILSSLFFSFTNYNLVPDDPLKFVGFKNFVSMFSDPQMQKAFFNTLKYIGIVVPLLILSPLVLALFLNAKPLWLKGIFITLFFLPNLIPGVVTGLIWSGTLSSGGTVNRFLQSLGLPTPMWLSDAAWVMPAIGIIGLWGIGNTILQLIAALKNAPKELYEAALIDGANSVVSFFRITVPLMSSVLFFNVVTAIISGFQYFVIAFLLFNGQGGPEDSAMFFMLKIFKEAITYRNMGYASAMSWAMLLTTLLITQALFWFSKRFVYYAGEERK